MGGRIQLGQQQGHTDACIVYTTEISFNLHSILQASFPPPSSHPCAGMRCPQKPHNGASKISSYGECTRSVGGCLCMCDECILCQSALDSNLNYPLSLSDCPFFSLSLCLSFSHTLALGFPLYISFPLLNLLHLSLLPFLPFLPSYLSLVLFIHTLPGSLSTTYTRIYLKRLEVSN